MIDLYYWPTPNGHKITMFLEEVGLPYEIKPVNIGRGDQFAPAFLAISPNNRMPAIVDHEPADGGPPLSLFESGAILEYLAEKTGRLLSKDFRTRWETLTWLYWQMGGVGPMFGQANHFARYAPEKIEYAINRYMREAERLLGILDDRLEGREFMVGDYSIADIASYPWVEGAFQLVNPPGEYPHVHAWRARIRERPATVRAYERGKNLPATSPASDEEARKILFNQGRRQKQ
jgi:GST-like protein